MIAQAIHWSLKDRLVVVVGAILLLFWGGYETVRMPVDVFPDLTAPTVTVVVEAHGMAPREVETLVTLPIETALNGASGVRRVRSSTGVGIQKQPKANTLALTEAIDTVLAQVQATLPEGMEIETHVFRQADFISLAIDNLLTALRDGALLIVVIVFAFLMSLRATLITLLAIPLSLMAAILAMKALGATINTMTLGGMAIALGALVDDAIIVVENIVRRLRERQLMPDPERSSVPATVFEATREIQGSIVFATLIIMLVFLPLFFLSGV
jgi:Cu/Ag efflux pump CusA